ncbi:MAG: c-type cytochrome [Beijerinckiaceae bacterium]
MPVSTRFARAASLATILTAAVIPPGLAADARKGEQLAMRWCASCHVVASDQQRAQSDAPTFAAISATRRIPEITNFLRQSHPQMPDMSLSRDEIADLITYMHTLAPPVEPAPSAPVKDDYKPPSRG